MQLKNLYKTMVFGLCIAYPVLAAGEEVSVRVVKRPPMDRRNGYYVSNRSSLAPSPFVKLPIGAIKPRGWLLHQLKLGLSREAGFCTSLNLNRRVWWGIFRSLASGARPRGTRG
ncbi:MAG: hypothetical protein ACYSX1_07865 [Planctomycetota bacterium]|jgi:hypothetical protein